MSLADEEESSYAHLCHRSMYTVGSDLYLPESQNPFLLTAAAYRRDTRLCITEQTYRCSH